MPDDQTSNRATPGRYDQPQIVGHRGAAALAPENTLAGIEAAAAAGCRGVEVDVMLSGDGHAVLHHDVSLQRCAGVQGRVDRTPQAELAALDVGSHFHKRFRGEPVPTLAQALAKLLDLGLSANLEIKPAPGFEAETAAEAVRLVRELWPADAPALLLSSFRRRSLQRVCDLAPELPRALIADRRPQAWRRELDELGCCGLHLSRRWAAPAIVEGLQEAGYGVGVYTVNDPQEAATFRTWGVDCLITDRPDAVARALPAAAAAQEG